MTRAMFRLLLLFGLMAVVLLEGYYIVALRHRAENQEEELKAISMQLQSSRNERDVLREELLAIKKAVEKNNGNASQREH
jgi:predicted Holliday junction resolvase-like endonuclease